MNSHNRTCTLTNTTTMEHFESTQQHKFKPNEKKNPAKHMMKTKHKKIPNSSSSNHKLSMNKELQPKHKPISKKNINKCEKSRGKTTKTSRIEFKTENPYLLLDDFELKKSNNGVWKWEHEVFGKEIVQREDEQTQMFERKLKKI